MKTLRRNIAFITSAVLIMAGCKPATSNMPANIASFREHYPSLLREAQSWRADAYLDDARIFLFPESPDANAISAVFYSPVNDLESLAVDLHIDGIITSKVFTQEYLIYQHEPITEEDWKIDSQEALDYMRSEAGWRFLDPDNNRCSFIMLKRILPAQGQPVIWSLTLWDCENRVQHSYLDANSGRILEASAINIKPTRFPTPIP
jgi:hypothetical protein